MRAPSWCVILTTLAVANAVSELTVKEDDEDCAIPPPFHHILGTYTITAIFDIHYGINCSHVNEKGFSMMTSAIQTIRLLNDIQYIPGVDIGLLVYDTCSKADESQKAVVHAHVMNQCTLSVSLGVLTTQRIAEELKILAQTLQLNLTVATETEPRVTQVYIDSTVELLNALGRKSIELIVVDDTDFSERMVREITRNKICVKKIQQFADSCDPEKINKDAFIILAGSTTNIHSKLKLFPKLDNCILIPFSGRLNLTEVAFIRNHYILSVDGSIFRNKNANNSRTHRDTQHLGNGDQEIQSEPSEVTREENTEDGTEDDTDELTSEMPMEWDGNSKRLRINEILSKPEITKVDKIRILFDLLHNGGMKNLDDVIQVDEDQTTGVISTLDEAKDDQESHPVDRVYEEDEEEGSGMSVDSTVYKDVKQPPGWGVYFINTIKRESPPPNLAHPIHAIKVEAPPPNSMQPVEINSDKVASPAPSSAHPISGTRLGKIFKGTGERQNNHIQLEIMAEEVEVTPPVSSPDSVVLKDVEQIEDQVTKDIASNPEVEETAIDDLSSSSVTQDLTPVADTSESDFSESVTISVGESSDDSDGTVLAETTESDASSETHDTTRVSETTMTVVDYNEYIEDSPVESSVNSVDVLSEDSIDQFRSFFTKETELVKINLNLVRIARTIIRMIEQFKIDFNIKCFYDTHNSSCVGDMSKDHTGSVIMDASFEDSIVTAVRLLKLNENIIINGLSIESAYGEILYEFNFDAADRHWYLSKNNKMISQNKTTQNICQLTNCSECVNFYKTEAFAGGKQILYFLRQLSVKTDVYIVVLLTISVIGIILSVCIGIFIVVRILKRDILEGNPLLTILLLIAVIFTYLSVIPFVLKVTDKNALAYESSHTNDVYIYHKSSETALYLENVLCLTKIIILSSSFNLLFGIILARSLMLSNCDRYGSFLSHIDGYIQITLLFFILLVQVCVNVELYIFNTRYDLKICVDSANLSLYFQIYNTFLLILCLFTVPFIYKSKRNYNEGLYLTIVVVFLSIVWFVWISIHHFYDAETTGIKNIKEMTALSGLVASATGVLVLIFIPRTYLMLTGIVRDNITASLPTLGYTNSSSVLDVTQYRSTQALYDTVGQVNTIKSGQMNPNYYMERPATPSTSKLEPTTSRSPENTYERYGTPPSPLKVTRF